ncbi:hypothetical protein, partial [Aliivibrio fischeri]
RIIHVLPTLTNLKHNACITRLLPCRLSLNLPLNAVNPKKPRMPNVANRVDAFVIPLIYAAAL